MSQRFTKVRYGIEAPPRFRSKIRLYRLRREQSLWIFVGPWAARLSWGPGSFGWFDSDGRVTRFIRRWWSGWYRWQDGDDE